MRNGWALIAALILIAGPASGQDDCRDIADDAERLACYDRLAGRVAPAEADEPPAEPDPEPTPVPAVETRAAAEAKPAPEQVETVRRGLLRSVIGRIKPTPKPRTIIASGKLVRVRELVEGNFELELEDGQVWREYEREVRTNYRVGDVVVVSTGLLGTFNLDSERTGRRTKVRRVR